MNSPEGSSTCPMYPTAFTCLSSPRSGTYCKPTKRDYPGRIQIILPPVAKCKLLIGDFESERHPDLALYLTPVPETSTTRAFGHCGYPRS